jgi:hypothetical protein
MPGIGMAVFEFLRLSLSVPKLLPLDGTKHPDPTEDRQSYINYIFGEPHEFFFRRSLFSYVPARSMAMPKGIVAGFIGRRTETLKAQGPEHLFALAPSKEWNAAFLVVDTRPDQQVVAIEKKHDVGASHSVLEHLADSKLKQYRKTAWHVDIEYISNAEDFFEVAKKYLGQITELSFTFHPPNGLRGWDEFKELDRIGKQQTNAEKSEYAFKNKSGGIVPEGEFVNNALEYASEGAGVTKLKAGKRTVYNSRQHKETVEVSEGMMPRDGEEIKVAGTAEHVLASRKKRNRREPKK